MAVLEMLIDEEVFLNRCLPFILVREVFLSWEVK